MVANAVTDEFGGFIVDLPSRLHAIPNLEKICRVKILLSESVHFNRSKTQHVNHGVLMHSTNNYPNEANCRSTNMHNATKLT